MEVQVQINNCL